MKEIPFYKPFIDQREKTLINEVLDLEKANKVETLEKEFTKYIPCGDAISTVNGTAAMHLAMCALDLKRGDKIICSVNAFPSVAPQFQHIPNRHDQGFPVPVAVIAEVFAIYRFPHLNLVCPSHYPNLAINAASARPTSFFLFSKSATSGCI